MRKSAPPLDLSADASHPDNRRHAADSPPAIHLSSSNPAAPSGYFDLIDKDPPSPGSVHSELSIIMPPTPTTTAMALAALQYLPVPILVLSSMKTVVLANEAMGRLLDLDRSGGDEKDRDAVQTVTDTLHGQTVSELGIDMLQDGSPIWISWEVRRLYRISPQNARRLILPGFSRLHLEASMRRDRGRCGWRCRSDGRIRADYAEGEPGTL